MKTFKFVITTPDGDAYNQDIVKVSLRGVEGELAIMAKHTPFITAVKAGECRIETEDGKQQKLEITSGLLSVTADCTTLMTGSVR